MNKKTGFLIILSFFVCSAVLKAQPALPEVGTLSQNGINILSWTNPYTSGVKTILVQRSRDSVMSFSTIGTVANMDKPVQSFVDAHPLPGNNYYIIKVIFTSETDWQSNTVMLHVDSNAIANQKVLPPNDSLQKLIGQMGSTPSVDKVDAISYTRSKYVYTNPFNGNINIEVPEPFKNAYKLIFYDQNGKDVLDINRLNDSFIVLDKRNFQASGVYKFKLLKDNQKFDDGFITIY